ncbi:hypothetical protein ACIRJM_13690 [Streptomyces sp. NPDC102405]|uniref:hypothetical protein n=1 Tax=Streptomyces sp. NPDC102405 TaxID=3366170 RepID=UPI0037F9CD5B
MSTPDEIPEISELDAAPLTRWERLAASLLGIALAGAGATAVFVTSNQAGSVALLLVGVLLLIMGVNGSPLTRARYQDYEFQMARRRRRIAEKIEQEPPETARQALHVLNTIDPGAARDPAVARVSGIVYEREVVNRLARIYPEIEHRGGAGDLGIDATMRTPGGLVGVQIKAGIGVLSGPDLRDIVEMAGYARQGAAVPIDGLLVITSRSLPPDPARRIRDARADLPTVAIRWLDEQDDQVLETKVQELVSRLNPSG